MLETVDAGEARPAAELDTDTERTAVQKFLYPDTEELPDNFSMPIWVCTQPQCSPGGRNDSANNVCVKCTCSCARTAGSCVAIPPAYLGALSPGAEHGMRLNAKSIYAAVGEVRMCCRKS